MATFLYRLGRASFVHRRLALGIWVLLLVGTSIAAAALSGPTSTSFSIPGTQAQEAIDRLQARFPAADATGAAARIVFAAPDGTTLADPANAAAVAAVLAQVGGGAKVANVSDPFTTPGTISQDGKVAFSQVTYRVTPFDLTEADREALLTAAETGRAAGVTVEMGGDALQPAPEQGASEAIGILIAAVVLFITFGSFIAAGLPLLTALIGIGIGVGLITTATGFVQLSATSSILAVMIGLAVSIDYALFILSRFRGELNADADLDTLEAVGRAVGTAGSAVVFAGLTVVIALTGLAVVGIPILTEMGIAAAVTVAVAVLVAITLLPALLGFAGTRVLGRRGTRRAHGTPEVQDTKWLRWPRFIARRPLVVLIGAVALLLVIALPALDLRLGLPDDSTSGPSTTQRKAYDLLAAGFGPGFNGPLTLVLDATGNPDAVAAAQQVAADIQALPDVLFVAPAMFNAAGDTAILSVVPASGPSAPETVRLVSDIRAAAPAIAAETGIAVGVTGQTAITIDISQKLGDALLPYLLIVVGLAFILLTLVFRSLLVPLTATLGFLLSVAATFGAVVAVFQWGWFAGVFGVEQPSAIVSLLPVFMIGVVFGLAMDYQVFLVTRMREEHVHGADATTSVITGFGHGAPVVTAAAIIMMGVFGGFILGADALVKSIGFAFAIAVLFDAFVVRMTIVPAVLVLLQERAWWLPRWLDRVLPDVDVEGAKLEHRTAGREPEPTAPALPAA